LQFHHAEEKIGVNNTVAEIKKQTAQRRGSQD